MNSDKEPRGSLQAVEVLIGPPGIFFFLTLMVFLAGLLESLPL